MLFAHSVNDIASNLENSTRNGAVLVKYLPTSESFEQAQESHAAVMGVFPLDCTCPEDIDINSTDTRWVCHVCTFLNHPELFQCEICDTFCVDGLQAQMSEGVAYDASTWKGVDAHSAGYRVRTNGFSSEVYSKLSRVSRSLRGSMKLTSSPPVSANESDDLIIAARTKLQRLHSGASSKITSAKQAIFQRARRSSADLLVSEETMAVLDVLQADLNHRCVRGNDMFEVLLVRFWNTIHQHPLHKFQEGGTSKAFERISSRWVELGFQREDPQTDFRGGGILALKCLVYVFERYPHKMLNIVKHQQPSGSKKWYPVCAAGINLTCIIADILHLGTGGYANMYEIYWKLFAEPNSFYELFYWAFVKMDAAWHRFNGSYMEFSVVLKSTRHMIQSMLQHGPQSIEDLRVAAELTRVEKFVDPFAQPLRYENDRVSVPYEALDRSRGSLTDRNFTRAVVFASC